jgi:histidinol-phosphatase (PHP family)
MILDTHVHSKFSVDGHSSVEEMVVSAIGKGVSVLCFTEHFDSDPEDIGCGFFDYEAYRAAIGRARDRYSDRIEILMGIEFSEPQLYEKELELCNERAFDFILGSVHHVVNEATARGRRVAEAELDGIYERHYAETLAACRRGGFDALAHIDVPTRYLSGRRESAALIAEIMEAMVEKDISLEVNTWSLRKGVGEPSPSESILKAYGAAGGRYVTMGSDAHCAGDVAACMAEAGPDGFEPCFYRGRSRVFA